MALVLSMLMLLSAVALTACNQNKPAETTDGGGSSDTTVPVTEDTTPAVTEAPPPIPAESMDGYEFIIYSGVFSLVTSIHDFEYNEENATVLDNAVFQRNAAVEALLDISIASETVVCNGTSGSAEGYTMMLRNKTANNYSYDAVILPAYDQSLISYSGANYDLNSVPYLDLKNSWWDQQAVNSLEIKGLQFFTTGDFSIDNFNSTILVTFNKKLAEQKDIPDLYQLVNEGKWTIDKWMELSAGVAEDLNGDDKWTDKDLYGTIVWDDAIYGVVNAAGELCCETDESGNFVLTLGTERVFDVFQKYSEFALDNSKCIRYQQTFNEAGKATFNAGSPLEFTLFPNDQGLFLLTWFGVTTKFRDMETDYGILPMFKYDEEQKNYYNTVAPYNARFLSMPLIQEDVERVGKIIETIGFYSQKYVKPAYFDRMLYGSIVRDEESRPMLELIHANRVYDIGYYYQPSNINKQLLLDFRALKTNFTNSYNGLSRAAGIRIKTINGLFDKLVEEWSK